MSEWIKPRMPLKWVEGFQMQGNAPLQEDYFEINPERGIFILADGFGGSLGRVAAELCVKSVRQFFEQEAGDLDATLPFELRPYYSLAGNVLFNAVSFANQKLLQRFKGKSWMESGGASLVAASLEGKLLSIANVGSCSVHLCRKDRVKEIVLPKTLARQINPFDDESTEGRFVPLMSYGTARQLEPEITEIEIQTGDQLCFQTPGVNQTLLNAIFSLESPENLSQIIDSHHPISNASAIWTSF